jgi:hypothetical protein
LSIASPSDVVFFLFQSFGASALAPNRRFSQSPQFTQSKRLYCFHYFNANASTFQVVSLFFLAETKLLRANQTITPILSILTAAYLFADATFAIIGRSFRENRFF